MFANYNPRRLFRPLILAALTLLIWHAATGTARAETAAVLDFSVAPGIDPQIGREASRSLWFELARSTDSKLVPWAQVEETCSKIKAQPAYNDVAQARIAQAVKADTIFTGTVLAVIQNDAETQVQVEVRQLDAANMIAVNGARAEGRSSLRHKSQVAANALDKAVATALLTMKQNVPLQHTLVTGEKSGVVELPLGTKHGVALYQSYAITRVVFNKAKRVYERVRVGELQIRQVSEERSTSQLMVCSTARPGDQIHQIFYLPPPSPMPAQPRP